MSVKHPVPLNLAVPAGTAVAIVASRFNADITDRLLHACQERLAELGVEKVETFRVPGAFELPVAAKWCADTGRYAAVICLGCVVRGDTPHFDYVAGECAAGVRDVGIRTGVPTIFGVLTTNTDQQAEDRTPGNGISAADAACEMIALRGTIAQTARDGGPH